MRYAAIVLALALIASAQAATTEPKLQGTYFLFSGTLGEQGPPTRTDAKISFQITGHLADEMYSRLGAKAQSDACTGGMMRTLRDVVCVRAGRDTTCYLGLDLKTGKTTSGVIC